MVTSKVKWKKYFKNGNIKYEGQFQDNYPVGIFKFYYETSELKVKKNFFIKVKAAATRFYNKDGKIMSMGLYVDEVKNTHGYTLILIQLLFCLRIIKMEN